MPAKKKGGGGTFRHRIVTHKEREREKKTSKIYRVQTRVLNNLRQATLK
jgi:hypothetical protein